MHRPEQLSHTELIDLVDCIQQLLYLDSDGQDLKTWNPNKQWDGADICDQLALAMSHCGLVPKSVAEFRFANPQK